MKYNVSIIVVSLKNDLGCKESKIVKITDLLRSKKRNNINKLSTYILLFFSEKN